MPPLRRTAATLHLGGPWIRRERRARHRRTTESGEGSDQSGYRAREEKEGPHGDTRVSGGMRAAHPRPRLELSSRTSSAPKPYSRIGITTYFVCVVPGAWIRQLLFESVSPISTLSLSIAPRASRR